MKNLLIVSISVLLLSSFSTACTGQTKPLTNTTSTTFVEKIDGLIAAYEKLDIFSGVVLIAEKGVPLYHQAFGLADREKNILNTTSTLFDIGSMNKTFTAIVVKQLIHEGQLAHEDKLTDYISGFAAPDASQITVRHLLDHQSGFGDYHSPDYFNSPKSERSLAAIVERAKAMPLFFPPGAEEEYSNTGYVLLGAIIEKASGKSYFQNVRERIVAPLGLKNTYLQNLDLLSDRIAHGYYHSPFGKLQIADDFQDEPNPDGGFLSTTEDVMVFYRNYYYENQLLPEEVKSEDPYFQFLQNLEPGKATGSAGGFEGFNTTLFQVISDDLTIIVFANMDEPVAENIASDILALSRGQVSNEPQLPAVQNVRKHYEQYGNAYVKEHFTELSQNFHPADPKDMILNSLGYAYLYEKEDVTAAVDCFRLNTELFPEVANCWDSYGEALRQQGKQAAALKAYQQALALDPQLPSALQAVAELKN